MAKEMLIEKGTNAYKRMELFVQVLNFMQDKNVFEIKNVYFDYGSKTLWTTLVAQGEHTYQILYPSDWDTIVNGEKEDLRKLLLKMVEKINYRGW